VMGWLAEIGVTVEAIHAHVHGLQRVFVEKLAALRRPALHPGQLVVPIEAAARGHFLTFRTADAGPIHHRLLDANVVTDYRGDRLRFGFGLYHDADDVAQLCGRLARVLT
jgi:kynureninase